MSITKYHALLISDKPSAQGLMNIFLKEAGISSFSTATTQREAVTLASKEFPHIIVCVDDLPDATCIQVVEALRKNPVMEKAMVFVMRNSTQAEIMTFMKLKVSALVAKDSNPNVFIEKVKQKLALLQGLSPYSIRGEELPSGAAVTIRAHTKILGRHLDHVICASNIEARAGTILSVVPDNPGVAPFSVTFTGASGVGKRNDGRENLFCISDVAGKGRQWLEESLTPVDSNASGPKKKILVYDKTGERARSIKAALSIHDIDCDNVSDATALISRFTSAPELLGAVFLTEPLDTASAAPWDKFKTGLPAEKRPIEMIAVIGKKEPSPMTIWMQKPFGIEHVVQNFKAAVASRHKTIDLQAAGTKQIPAIYIAPAKVLALDEMGAVLQAPFMPEIGTELFLESSFFASLQVFNKVKVTQAEPLSVNPKFAIIRVQVLDIGVAKDKDKLYAAELKALEVAKGGAAAAAGGVTNKPQITSLRGAAAQIANQADAKPLAWAAQKSEAMPKFSLSSATPAATQGAPAKPTTTTTPPRPAAPAAPARPAAPTTTQAKPPVAGSPIKPVTSPTTPGTAPKKP